MNYNANANARQPGPRKVKRVSDINAMGAPAQPAFNQNPYGAPQAGFNVPPQQPQGVYGAAPGYGFSEIPQMPPQQPQANQFPGQFPQNTPYGMPPPQQQQQQMQQPGGMPGAGFGMFNQPIVQDMAFQYGQKLADQGKELVNKEFEKYIPVSKLKYYFAVDNKYVVNKIKLIFFPFLHTDWSLKYDQENPVQPRFDINALDLYIPMMAYITYVVLAGLVLGMQDRFSPEQLGIQASSALAYTIVELIIYSVTLYVTNIPTTLRTLDLLALSGYKYTIIVAILLWSILLQKMGYWLTLIYSGFSLGFFLLRTLKAKVLADPTPTAGAYESYGQQNAEFSHNVARKRKLYFLFLVAGLQPVLSFWLTMHLIPASKVALDKGL
ncbi:protein YIF1B [Culicoides brevitarsis]|uniref:protein YIF1B n=1 Tax=Culicoides brevitarsis TaxID=469753 RepID=UPI00307BC695